MGEAENIYFTCLKAKALTEPNGVKGRKWTKDSKYCPWSAPSPIRVPLATSIFVSGMLQAGRWADISLETPSFLRRRKSCWVNVKVFLSLANTMRERGLGSWS